MITTYRSRNLFFLMFTIVLLLNINFSMLRILRTTLAVVDLGHGAYTIPIFELFGAMPGAFVITWLLTRLLNRFSMERVFLIFLSLFIGFFLLISILHPYLTQLKNEQNWLKLLPQITAMLFYTMSELWKPVFVLILFWGLINLHVPVEDAKKLYSTLMLGGSLGGMIAGPITSLCTSQSLFISHTDPWDHSLNIMILTISLIGIIVAFLYHQLSKSLLQKYPKNQKGDGDISQNEFSIKNCLNFCLKDKQLRLLSWLVIADYISYSLGEVIFLDILRIRFPQAIDYCHYMGYLSFWGGTLTFVSTLFIAPYILQNYRWVVASLITPLCLLITEGAFFIFLRGYSLKSNLFGWSNSEWIAIVTILGSLQYCICRAAKYTLFDASKELAFVFMPDHKKMHGKLMVDGLCARFGKGGASLLSITLITLCGGILASAFFTGLIAIGVTISWIASTLKLGNIIEKPSKEATLT